MCALKRALSLDVIKPNANLTCRLQWSLYVDGMCFGRTLEGCIAAKFSAFQPDTDYATITYFC